jgi:hypothetical protein
LLKAKIFESKINLKFLGAINPKGINKIAKNLPRSTMPEGGEP